ncbi:hypothetical protein [Streptomyces sp. NBC_00663]|uniref:hypothetical protein n=1 Tax=Streptomyces sp. NBC_00663 TaxID=2975801 RepID=UPI003FCE01D7
MEIKCTQCQTPDLQPAFIEDGGDHASGFSRWIPGPLERGLFGGAKRWGRPRYQIDAYRCEVCGHLELFAPHEV